MPDRDYSHRSLMDKLGVEPGRRVAALNLDGGALCTSLSQITGKSPARALRGEFDLIFLQINGHGDLLRIPKAAAHLRPAGALWIIHPKGKTAAVKDAEVREVYLRCGLVDNKVSAYTDTHTATRCVIRKTRRA